MVYSTIVTAVAILVLIQGCQAGSPSKDGGRCLNVMEVIERDREAVLAIPNVVDLAYGEDEAGPHILVFVGNEGDVDNVKREISRLSLLAGCRVVTQPELRIGPK